MKVYRWTLDVLLIVALTLLADFVILIAGVESSLVRIAVLLPLLLVFPGYALVGVMYPWASSTDWSRDSMRRRKSGDRGIDAIERLGLSIAASLAVVPLLAFALNFTPTRIRTVPLLLSVSWFTHVFAFLAFVRRLGVPADHRFRIPPLSRVGDVTIRYFGTGRKLHLGRRPFEAVTGTHRLLNLLLVASLLVLAGSVAYAALAPPPYDEAFTGYYLVTRNESGQYTTTELPHELTTGQGTPISVAITNHEGHPTTYTTVAKLQKVRIQGSQTQVVDDRELDRFQTRVPPGGTQITDVTVIPTRSGEGLRLIFLLYKDDVPADPTAQNAYVEAHLYITVRSGAS